MKSMVTSESFVNTNRHSYGRILCIAVCNNNTSQITDINSFLYTSYATSRTSSAYTSMKQPSHYPVPVPVPAAYAGRYPATSGSSRILKIRIRYIPKLSCVLGVERERQQRWKDACSASTLIFSNSQHTRPKLPKTTLKIQSFNVCKRKQEVLLSTVYTIITLNYYYLFPFCQSRAGQRLFQRPLRCKFI